MDAKAKLESVNYFFKVQGLSTCRCHEPSETCTEAPIRAHSIPTSTVLNKLARNGHVVMPHLSLKYPPPSEVSFKPVGINNATTFSGLCSRHDNEIFRPIDSGLPNVSDPQHLFLLAYRAVLREYHVVLQNAARFQATYQKRVELGLSPGNVPCQFGMFATEHLANAFDCYTYKRIFDDCYLNQTWDRIPHATVALDAQEPTIAVSSLFSLDDVPAPEVPRVALSIFPNDGNVMVVFSSTDLDWPYVSPFLDRILNATSFYQRYLISKLVLENCDNFVISPDYYGRLSATQQATLCQFYTDTTLETQTEHEDKDLYLF